MGSKKSEAPQVPQEESAPNLKIARGKRGAGSQFAHSITASPFPASPCDFDFEKQQPSVAVDANFPAEQQRTAYAAWAQWYRDQEKMMLLNIEKLEGSLRNKLVMIGGFRVCYIRGRFYIYYI